MPVIEIQHEAPELSPVEVAAGLVSHLSDPLKASAFKRDMNALLTPASLCLVNRILTPADLVTLLSCTEKVAKQIMNQHGDILIGRKRGMSLERFNERLRNKIFRTQP